MDHLIAAIDGGGTKTVFALARTDGSVLGVGCGGPLNALFVPVEVARGSIRHAAMAALAEAGLERVRVDALYASAPGAGEAIVTSALDGIVESAAVEAAGDELSTFIGAMGERYGVVALAGTGSFATGFNRAGENATMGGWGPLLGDEGSAYQIGLNALKAATRASEGREEPTILGKAILDEWSLESERELVGASGSRDRVAGLARLVSEAAGRGDAVAIRILAQAGRELGSLAGHVLTHLEMRGEGCPVALAGGVSRAHPVLHAAFAQSIAEVDGSCSVVRPKFSPAFGAILRAMEMAASPGPLAHGTLERLQHEAACRELLSG
ncbi:MAG: BadF/BadG/BcrA/BcrD ATPase family protein [Clostridia bacterium]|nr:BadF/BadG/BcrA/BcrD ATPase family protein [Clostridia bacterium]